MTKKLLFSVTMACAISLLTACVDDNDGNQRYDDGYLHFNLQFNGDQQSRWTEDGTGNHTRMGQSLTLTSKDVEGLTLYLHSEESDIIETPQTAEQPDTRGKRLTGEAFANNDLTTFGLYGQDEDKNVVLGYTKQLKSNYTKNGDFYESSEDQALQFTSNEGWPDNKKATFYGFAPYHYTEGDAEGTAKNISVNTPDNVPVITYTMQPDEADNKDVLTAKKELTRAEKNDKGIELVFHHILSAVKFKQPASGMTCKVKDGDVDKETYYVKIKKIELKNIYRSGTARLGEEYTDADGDPKARTSNWTYMKESANQSTSSYTLDTPTTSADTYINTDEHCFMVLPQELPTDASVQITCDLYTDAAMATTPKFENATFNASLSGKTWLPGYSYTYTLSESDLVHVLIISGDAFPGDFSIYGASKEFTVRSFYTNARADNDYSSVNAGIPAPWKPQFKEGSSDWQDGMPLGFEIIDKNGKRVEDLSSIPGSVAGTTYKLEASVRLEDSQTVSELRNDDRRKENYDLSTNGGITPMNTANCYVVTGYGTYKLPIAYGNAIKNGLTNYAAFTEADQYEVFVNYEGDHITKPWIADDTGDTPSSASIVWEDEKNLFTNVELSTDKKYLCFEIQKRDIKNGNAILAVKNSSGTIMWSWHIWVTDEGLDDIVSGSDNMGHSFTYLKRSLGWRLPETIPYALAREFSMRIKGTDATSTARSEEKTVKQNPGTVYISGSNLYYQFGRKDPSPGTILKYSDENTAGTEYDMTNDIIANGYNWSVDASNRPEGFKYGIMNPNIFYGTEAGHNWMATDAATEHYSGGWDVQKATGASSTAAVDEPSSYAITKTVNDPCPVGFSVAPHNGYDILISWSNTALNESDTDTKLKGRRFTNGSQTIDLFLTGNRSWHYHIITGTNPVQRTNLEYFNQQARFWTAGQDSDPFGHLFRIQTTGADTYERYRSRGMSILPVGDVKLNEYALPIYSGNLFARKEGDSKVKAQYIYDNMINKPQSALVVSYTFTSAVSSSNINNFKIEIKAGDVTLCTITKDNCNITQRYQNFKIVVGLSDAMKAALKANLDSNTFAALITGTATNGIINYISVVPDANTFGLKDGQLNQNESLSRRKNF